MLSAKRIIGTKIVTLMIILSISFTPFPGAFFWIQTAFCREGFKQTDYKSRVVLIQGGVFLLAKFRGANYTCAGGFACGNEKINSWLLVAVQRLLVERRQMESTRTFGGRHCDEFRDGLSACATHLCTGQIAVG